jgi:hypothetical protein
LFPWAGALLLVLLLASPGAAPAGDLPAEGDALAGLELQTPGVGGDARELGVQGRGRFTLQDLDRSVVLLEVVGVYCSQCARQAPLFNNLHRRLARRGLLDDVAMIALAAGATPQEGAYLRESGLYDYPVIIDPEYALHKKLNEPETPFTMLLGPDRRVAFARLGVEEDVEGLYRRIKELLDEHGD